MRRILSNGPRLVAAAHRPEQIPRSAGWVVAFAGRSNVGKSSLINRLVGDRVARVAKRPGVTRGIYFYEGSEPYRVADLPGFGYAAASRAEREGWRELMKAYFEKHPPSAVVHLVDPRVPVSPFDVELHEALAAWRIPEILVATKVDRLRKSLRAQAERALCGVFGGALLVSSRTGEGVEELKAEILAVAGQSVAPRRRARI